MENLNLKVIRIDPSKIVVINGEKYLILDEDVAIEHPGRGKTVAPYTQLTNAESASQRDKVLAIIQRNPGITKKGVLEAMMREHGITLRDSVWGSTQTRLKRDGKIRSENIPKVEGDNGFPGSRYYAIQMADPELERLLAEEEEIEREVRENHDKGHNTEMTDYEAFQDADEAYREFCQETTAMHLDGMTNADIARHFGINEATVRQTLGA